MKKVWRVCLAWGYREDFGEVHGTVEYGRRFGPFRFIANHIGDIDMRKLKMRTDIDGVIVHRYGLDLIVDWTRVKWPAGVPVVSIEGSKSRLTDWQVLPDDRAIGRRAAQEFLQRGFKRFAYCAAIGIRSKQHKGDWDQDRLAGFRAAIQDADSSAEPAVYEAPEELWGRFEREWTGPLAKWLASLPKPIGILAAQDLRARHLLLAAEVAGVRVPEEAAVIGVGNGLIADIESRGISSVEIDGYRIGYAAMEMLHQRMEGQSIAPGMIRVPPRRLVIRRSSDVLAIEDPEVAAALHFIAEHATAGINVGHVVESVAVSRRSLEYRFQAVLGRSILHEIRRIQIERAKLLLADPEIPLPRVAKVAGFSSAQALSEIFHRITDSTPSAYRAAAGKAAIRPDTDS